MMRSARALLALLLCLLPLLASAGSSGSNGDSLLNLLRGQSAPEILPAEQAFRFTAEPAAPDELRAGWTIEPGYYLYRDKIRFELEGTDARITEVLLPPGQPKEDEYFGRMEVYHDAVAARLRLDRPLTGPVTLVAHYQGCAEKGVCYPPMTTEVALSPAAPAPADPAPAEVAPRGASTAAATADADAAGAGTAQLGRLLDAGSVPAILGGFFVAGLLLAFTACLYPMIPILSGLIAGDRHRRHGARAFWLSLVYVEASAVTYALAGVAAGLTGQALQADLQGPWVLGAFAGLFVLLALSMFGLYDLQLPNRWQTRLSELSRHQKGGSLLGVAIMGALSALIVGACSGPALIAALAFISTTGDVWLGGLALFVLANGMGAPLLLIGTAAGRWLPHAGPWMAAVKRVFGVLFLAVALWMIERLLDPAIALALWGALLLGVAVYLGALDHLRPEAGGWQRARKTGGLLLLTWGVLLLIGAAAGNRDFWRPLSGVGLAQAQRQELQFRPVKGPEQLQQALQQAAAAGRPVMVDVYADWCVYCVKLERETFPDPAVRAALADALLLRADVTAMDPADKALLARLDVFLPPAVLFYGRDGRERSAQRIVGFIGPEQFAERARRGLDS